MDGDLNFGGTGEIDPIGGDGFYSSARDSPSTGISETGGLLPAEEPIPADTVNDGGDGGSPEPDFGFALRTDPDDSSNGYVVLASSVNTVTVDQYAVSGTPSQLWLEVTVNASGVPTAAEIVIMNPGNDTAIRTSRLIASPTWDMGELVTPAQGIKGAQNIVSCGTSHGWSSLYL